MLQPILRPAVPVDFDALNVVAVSVVEAIGSDPQSAIVVDGDVNVGEPRGLDQVDCLCDYGVETYELVLARCSDAWL